MRYTLQALIVGLTSCSLCKLRVLCDLFFVSKLFRSQRTQRTTTDTKESSIWCRPILSKINLYLAPEQNQKHTIQRQPGYQLPVSVSSVIWKQDPVAGLVAGCRAHAPDDAAFPDCLECTVCIICIVPSEQAFTASRCYSSRRLALASFGVHCGHYGDHGFVLIKRSRLRCRSIDVA